MNKGKYNIGDKVELKGMDAIVIGKELHFKNPIKSFDQSVEVDIDYKLLIKDKVFQHLVEDWYSESLID